MRATRPTGLFVVVALVVVLLASATPLLAKSSGDPDHWCGTTRSSLAVALGVHDEHQHDHIVNPVEGADGNGKALGTAKEADRHGEIAIVTDGGDLFRQPNPVDLGGTGLQFTRQGKGLKVAAVAGTLFPVSGPPLALTDDSTLFFKFPKGFKFTFFGKSYTGVYLNSDGNLTFGAGDDASTERGLQRLLNGPPRIAPFFSDLNPETAAPGGGIFVSASKTAVRFTWVDVPAYSTSPVTEYNNFQVTLEKTGRVTFAYGDLPTPEAIVGVSPGGAGALDLVDYQTQLPLTVTNAIAERFTTDSGLDDLAVAQSFFRRFADDYDHLIVWLDFDYSLGVGAFAYEFSLKNEVKGIGEQIFDDSLAAGSHGRLRSFVQMGSLNGARRYPDNPDSEFLGTNTTMDVLGQEAGHRWGAFLPYKDGNDYPLLGRSFAHWSYAFDSDASDMEGNDILDLGGGVFRTVDATSRFSDLDMYSMGLLAPGEVGPLFYVKGSGVAPGHAPEIGAQLTGQRVDLTVDDIIRQIGPRVPASAQSPHSFNMAFVLVEPAGQTASQASLDKIERFRTRWESYFQAATRGLSAVDTTLRDR
ncbi:MAG TPA: hypothetical protein VGV61_07250 [Thermoanaerobaculia bacterium]|jgi:hypothetical protein|nr:hypothetical protein [Thermoanaerobaculia bacterium]